jgi:transaldolase
MSYLDHFKKHTIVVCDTGDFESIQTIHLLEFIFINYYFYHKAMKKFKPTDATTNPSLILQASQLPQYKHLIDQAIEYAKKQTRYKKSNNIIIFIEIFKIIYF